MARPARPRTHAGSVSTVVALALALTLGACGADDTPTDKSDAEVVGCGEQWRELANTLLGLDDDTHASALASRWTAIIASIDYYETSEPTENCQEQVERQTTEISSLRQFSDKLRPYDMSFQLDQVRAGIDLYLHDPLPAPRVNDNGKKVAAPSKKAVDAAFTTLEAQAATADADLAVGWSAIATVPLGDADALRAAVMNLDDLAQASTAWQECEAALQVLVAAIRAQESQGTP